MSEMVAKVDSFGRPAWIVLMVLGFVIFWPIGLAILAFLIWSGRMACGNRSEMSRFESRLADKWGRMTGRWDRGGDGRSMRAYSGTGNAAFDEYRAETLRRLEEEAQEFRNYLERLRMAKDRAEFEQFMTDRRSRPTGPTADQGDERRPNQPGVPPTA